MRDTLLFSIKKDARSAKIQLQSNPHLRTHKISPGVRRSCLRAAAILVRSGEATVILAYRSGRLSIARDRFEVLGVRGDINKSTFGTEDKCNPLEAIIGAALRYQTLRSLTATEIGAAPRRRHVTQGGGVVVSDRHAAATSHGGHGERIDLTVMIQSRPRGTVTAKP